MKRIKGMCEQTPTRSLLTRGQYGFFPKGEYESRFRRAKQLMEQRNADALLISRKENIVYFSGTLWSSAGGLYALLPAKGDPVVFVPFLEYGNVLNTSWIEKIAPWSSYADPQHDERFPSSQYETIRKVVEKMIGPKARLGLDQSTMYYNDLEGIRSVLPESKLIDVSESIAEILMIKSDAEVDRIRVACEATCKGIKAGFESLRIGMTEREVARTVLTTVVENTGFIPQFVIVRSGVERSWMFNCVPSSKRIAKGDMVVIDAGGTYEGYPADVMRTACVGEPTERQKTLFEAEREAQQAAVESVRPGVKACDLYSTAVGVLRKHGIKDGSFVKTIGHGLGLGGYGPPLLTPSVSTELQRNMVVAVEPNMLDMPFIFSDGPRYMDFAVEDNVLVTAKGHEILTPLERDLWIVGGE